MCDSPHDVGAAGGDVMTSLNKMTPIRRTYKRAIPGFLFKSLFPYKHPSCPTTTTTTTASLTSVSVRPSAADPPPRPRLTPSTPRRRRLARLFLALDRVTTTNTMLPMSTTPTAAIRPPSAPTPALASDRVITTLPTSTTPTAVTHPPAPHSAATQGTPHRATRASDMAQAAQQHSNPTQARSATAPQSTDPSATG